MQNYEKAIKLINEAGGGDFEGKKPESLISRAEVALGIKFPPSYRRFLLEMGCGDISGVEIFGLINDNFQNSATPNGIWLTLNERDSIGLNPAYILVGENGCGAYYALDTRKSDGTGENPVVRLSMDGKQAEQVAESFGSYILNAVSTIV